MSLTPHGPGFSFLDSFTVTEPGRRGEGRKWLDPAAPFFADHFPGEPLMPAVLLVETAAQTAGALWASLRAADASERFALAQIALFKVVKPVRPGETIETEAILDQELGTLAQFSVTLRIDSVEVARGKLVLSSAQS